ncbi:Uncharacterised protein [Mycobacterium tuberculosis]|nr:Uncharacterised protein [Mycobacterium tuberculosis]
MLFSVAITILAIIKKHTKFFPPLYSLMQKNVTALHKLRKSGSSAENL